MSKNLYPPYPVVCIYDEWNLMSAILGVATPKKGCIYTVVKETECPGCGEASYELKEFPNSGAFHMEHFVRVDEDFKAISFTKILEKELVGEN